MDSMGRSPDAAHPRTGPGHVRTLHATSLGKRGRAKRPRSIEEEGCYGNTTITYRSGGPGPGRPGPPTLEHPDNALE